jgi:hypothetical protein
MKKGLAQKYFEQKNWTVLELILLGVAIIAAGIITFAWHGIPIGTPFFVVAVFALLLLKTQKIKDSEIDFMLNKWVAENIENEVLKKCIQGFNLQAHPIKKGKDNKMRSSIYTVTLVEFAKENASLTCWKFDLIKEDLIKENHTVVIGTDISLIEKSITVLGTNKEISFLKSDIFSSDIPVDINDITVDNIVKRLCGIKS